MGSELMETVQISPIVAKNVIHEFVYFVTQLNIATITAADLTLCITVLCLSCSVSLKWKRPVEQPVLQLHPFRMNATRSLIWDMLLLLSQSTRRVFVSGFFQPKYSSDGYSMWLDVACFHVDDTQQLLFQCLSKASDDGIMSSSNWILVHIRSRIRSSHLLCL